MSELFDAARAIAAEEAQNDSARQQILAAVAREKAAKLSRSQERLGTFVGIMLERKQPALPVYVTEYDQKPSIIRPELHLRAHRMIGSGWLLRKSRYEHEEGSTPGLIVLQDGGRPTVYECSDPTTDPPHRAQNFPAGAYVMAGYHIEYTPDGNQVPIGHNHYDEAFGDDVGKRILGQALADRGLIR